MTRDRAGYESARRALSSCGRVSGEPEGPNIRTLSLKATLFKHLTVGGAVTGVVTAEIVWQLTRKARAIAGAFLNLAEKAAEGLSLWDAG